MRRKTSRLAQIERGDIERTLNRAGRGMAEAQSAICATGDAGANCKVATSIPGCTPSGLPSSNVAPPTALTCVHPLDDIHPHD
jgi:hypothetical protein